MKIKFYLNMKIILRMQQKIFFNNNYNIKVIIK